jgi:hypothetical protein
MSSPPAGAVRTRDAARMRCSLSVLAICLTAWCLAAPAHDARAASKDPDWPCIQPKVQHLSAGMMWAGPEVKEGDDEWRQSAELTGLVQKLAARRLPVEEAAPIIADFAKAKGDDRKRQLTLLFTGLLQTINREREAIIGGIARYARQQTVRADGIRAARDELIALSAKASPTEAETARQAALEDKLNWETRIYDERAQSLTYVCESPRILEQRLFGLSRAIQQHLD